MPQPLSGAVVIITGASSGIGQATALLFAEHGARLLLAARNEKALSQVVADCRALGAETDHLTVDVSDAGAVKQLAQTAFDKWGHIDVWVNNVGVGAIGEFTATPIESHEQIIRTNLISYLYGAHAVLPYFQQQHAGVLINVNSLGGWVPAPYAVAYTASKFGLRGFSEALRGELGPWPGIHVCDIFPSFIDTPGLQHAANYAGREIKPLPPVYDPRRVARAIVEVATYPREAVTVGGSAWVARFAYAMFPHLVLSAMGAFTRRHLARAKQVAISDGNLFTPSADEPRIDGGWRTDHRALKGSVVAGSLIAGLVVGGYLANR